MSDADVLARRVAVLETVAEAARAFFASWDAADFHDPPGDKADVLRAALSAAGAATDQGDGT